MGYQEKQMARSNYTVPTLVAGEPCSRKVLGSSRRYCCSLARPQLPQRYGMQLPSRNRLFESEGSQKGGWHSPTPVGELPHLHSQKCLVPTGQRQLPVGLPRRHRDKRNGDKMQTNSQSPQ